MNNTLFVCDTHEQAKHKFNQFKDTLTTNQNLRVDTKNMIVELDNYRYEFIGLGLGLPNKVLGKEYSSVFISEFATEEQVMLLKTRERK